MTGHYRPRRAPRHETLRIRGLSHRITWWGERTRAPIVLLHGWMDSGDTWQFLVDRLPDSWSFVAPDWRGFGGSEWPQEGYWFPDYLADLEALLEVLVPDSPARIVGHSMGGNIAALYAGVRPARLAWLVDLEGFGLPRTSADEAPRRYGQWLDQLRAPQTASRYASAEKLATALHVRNPRLDRDKAAFIARAWTRPVEGGVELTADPRHRRVNPTLYRRDEVEACWRCVRIPVLLLLGGRSEFRSRLGDDASEEYFRSMFERLEIATLPQAGHMLHHELPEETARHIVRFAALHSSE